MLTPLYDNLGTLKQFHLVSVLQSLLNPCQGYSYNDENRDDFNI